MFPTRQPDMKWEIVTGKYVFIWKEEGHVLCVLPMKDPGFKIYATFPFQNLHNEPLEMIMVKKWPDIADAFLKAFVTAYGL